MIGAQAELRSAGPTRASVLTRNFFSSIGLVGPQIAEIASIVSFPFFLGCLLGRFSSSVGASHMKRGSLDGLAQTLQMLEGIFRGGVAKDDGKLLAATAESLALSTHFRQTRSHHAEHLVTGIVSVGIVELLEVVDIDDGDGILLVERKQKLVESAASANAGKFIVVGEHVGGLDQRGGEDQGGGGDKGVRRFADRGELQPEENCSHGPDKAGFDGLAGLKKTADEYGDSGHETYQNPKRDCRGARGMRIGGTIFWPAQHGKENRLYEEQSKAGRDPGNIQAALAHRGEDGKVQRDQQRGEFDCHASRPRMNLSGRKEIDSAMSEQQNQKGKQNAAGIETPGQKQSGGEYAHVVEGQGGRDLDEQGAVDERHHERQQQAARDEPRLPCLPVHVFRIRIRQAAPRAGYVSGTGAGAVPAAHSSSSGSLPCC